MTDMKTWFEGLDIESDVLGLESFDMGAFSKATTISPVSIVAENGIFYVTICACQLTDGTKPMEEFMIWLGSLMPTDHIRLSIITMSANVPYICFTQLLGALYRTKAHLEILMNTIVIDYTAYFYLVADTLTRGAMGNVLLLPYSPTSSDKTSMTYKVMISIIHLVLDKALSQGFLSDEDVSALHNGGSVILA